MHYRGERILLLASFSSYFDIFENIFVMNIYLPRAWDFYSIAHPDLNLSATFQYDVQFPVVDMWEDSTDNVQIDMQALAQNNIQPNVQVDIRLIQVYIQPTFRYPSTIFVDGRQK